MKNRIGELRQISPVFWDENADVFDQETLEVAEKERILTDVLMEAKDMQREIALLGMEVRQLAKQNGRFLTSVRRISSIKRGSSAIAQCIQARGVALYHRLHTLGDLSKELERKLGASAVVARIVRAQYLYMTSTFREAMYDYNLAEAAQKENCKVRIQRQAAILGRPLSSKEVDEMIETGRLSAFFTDGLRTSRSALGKIEKRHQEILALERRVHDVHELFVQVALLVEEQGNLLDNIEAHVLATQDYMGIAGARIRKAVRYKKRNLCRRAFLRCFHCISPAA